MEYDLKSVIKAFKSGKIIVQQDDVVKITVNNELKLKEDIQMQNPNLEIFSLIDQLVEQAKRLKV